MMLYPIWQPLPRPAHFPRDRKLNQLLASNFNPRLHSFELRMFRRNARDLRKGLFGPRGLRNVPKGEGVRRLDLPHGWTLRLTYGERPQAWRNAGDVVVEFISPAARERRADSPRGPADRVEEARFDARSG